jgi:hypothetical protein
MFYEVDADALTLLRALKDHHNQHNPGAPLLEGTRLAPELVAERAGLDPNTLRYERAVRHLVGEEALTWVGRLGSTPGIDFYRITERGLAMMNPCP